MLISRLHVQVANDYITSCHLNSIVVCNFMVFIVACLGCLGKEVGHVVLLLPQSVTRSQRLAGENIKYYLSCAYVHSGCSLHSLSALVANFYLLLRLFLQFFSAVG